MTVQKYWWKRSRLITISIKRKKARHCSNLREPKCMWPYSNARNNQESSRVSWLYNTHVLFLTAWDEVVDDRLPPTAGSFTALEIQSPRNFTTFPSLKKFYHPRIGNQIHFTSFTTLSLHPTIIWDESSFFEGLSENKGICVRSIKSYQFNVLLSSLYSSKAIVVVTCSLFRISWPGQHHAISLPFPTFL